MQENPKGKEVDPVFRGGSWMHYVRYCCVAIRTSVSPMFENRHWASALCYLRLFVKSENIFGILSLFCDIEL